MSFPPDGPKFELHGSPPNELIGLYKLTQPLFVREQDLAVLDAPLLYETKVLEWIAYPIVVVHVSDKELWLKRIMARDRCSKEEALLKISNQMPIETKIQMAEIKVDNLGDENSMMKQFGEQFLKFITVYKEFR